MKVLKRRHLPAPRTSPRLDFSRAMLAVIVVVLIGTVGYSTIEGWSIGQSFYFTLITLTTIGYSDYGLSEMGRLFTAVIMIGGLLVVTYSAGRLVPSLFSHQLIWERKMNARVNRLSDHYIICGLGRIGRTVCQHLARNGVPFIAIDRNAESATMLVDAGHLALIGDATDDHLLDAAGIQRARGIACVTGSETENIVITLSARAICEDLTIISRAENEESAAKFRRAGATRVISPIRSGGLSIANSILRPHLADFLDRTHDRTIDFELAEVHIEPGSELVGNTVREKGVKHEGVALLSLMRGDAKTGGRPKADERLAAGDVLIVAGDAISIDRLMHDAAGRSKAA